MQHATRNTQHASCARLASVMCAPWVHISGRRNRLSADWREGPGFGRAESYWVRHSTRDPAADESRGKFRPRLQPKPREPARVRIDVDRWIYRRLRRAIEQNVLRQRLPGNRKI